MPSLHARTPGARTNPLVSVVMTAYNHERFVARALDSVLGQDYPSDRIQVIMVDDGSTDGTTAAIEPYRDRITFIRQENGGLLSAVNRALSEVRGEFIAFCSGDDMLPPDKIRAQVDFLLERPDVGLVYGDLEVIDADDAVTDPSYFRKNGMRPVRGRILGDLLKHNIASGGSNVVRAEHMERFYPLPEFAAAGEDWWIALRVAEVAEIDFMEQAVYRYRFHGGNLFFGAQDEKLIAVLERDVVFRRNELQRVEPGAAKARDLVEALAIFDRNIAALAAQSGRPHGTVVPVGELESERAAVELGAARAALGAGDVEAAVALLVRALAHDPSNADARGALHAACSALASPSHAGGAASPERPSPLVSCVIPAYNYAAYIGRALDSVFAQDYPADAIEVVVVDDGSTDDTGAALGPYMDRIRYIRKENGGLNSAVDRGIAAASGELIALLDADDTWPAGKLRRQVNLLLDRPEVGLVYGDMEVIDDSDAVVNPSFFAMYGLTPARGRALGSLMKRNVVSGGSAMFRASLRHAYHPIGAASAFPDWWIAVAIARVAEIEFVPEPANRYRLHGDNMGFGVDDPERLLRGLRDREIPFRRWMLETVAAGEAGAGAVAESYRIFSAYVARVSEGLGVPDTELVPVDDERRVLTEVAARAAMAARERGDAPGSVIAWVNALAHDPWNERAQAGFASAVADVERLGALGAAPAADPLADARRFVTLAFAEELVADPGLLAAYGRLFSGDDDATLVIYAPGWSEEQAMEDLGAAVAAAGLDGEGAADLLLELGAGGSAAETVLLAGVSAVLSRRPAGMIDSTAPHFDGASVADLRSLATASGAAAAA